MGASPSSSTKTESCKRRIRKGLHRLWVDPPAFCRPGASPVTDLFHWEVYHPNIDSEGEMVLDIFHDEWSPALTIEMLLLSIVSVLYDPMLDHPVNDHIARLYMTDIKMYERKARKWTRRYASTPVAS
ncbi:unnamed protein product [Urochloa decumbens]|uniref:UBC core domain-containing protein n=1 Tax=Urochloa decumbens TaxID=240449 RepID=A0ABC8V6N6_9POAL